MPGYCKTCTTHHVYEEGHNNPIRTPVEWCQRTGVMVVDPDGWDRRNFAESWAEPIDRLEFRRRARASTSADPERWLDRV